MRRWIAFVASAVLLWWAAGFAAALLATQPWNVPVDARTEIAGRPIDSLEAIATDGTTTRGWLVKAAANSTRCVVFAAGIRGNRLAMLPRAEWYLANGWSVMLVDLRGTGASDAARVSMGWHEALDLVAWHDVLRMCGFTTVGAHGQSLGAAAVVFTAVRAERPPQWDFVVLESCYRDIEAALHARLPWVPFPSLSLWPLEQSAALLTGVDGAQLRPVDAIRALAAPTLLVCGSDDRDVGEGANAALLAACGANDKRAVEIAGAGHVDLLRVPGGTLQKALGEFLAGR